MIHRVESLLVVVVRSALSMSIAFLAVLIGRTVCVDCFGRSAVAFVSVAFAVDCDDRMMVWECLSLDRVHSGCATVF